jgi:hypothetical protein
LEGITLLLVGDTAVSVIVNDGLSLVKVIDVILLLDIVIAGTTAVLVADDDSLIVL